MIFAKKSVAFPGEDGIIFEAAEDGIVQWQKENLKGEEKSDCSQRIIQPSLNLKLYK